jgi:hypothetical protein
MAGELIGFRFSPFAVQFKHRVLHLGGIFFSAAVKVQDRARPASSPWVERPVGDLVLS